MPKSGDRVRLADGRLGMYRVCDVCDDVIKIQYKSPPFPHKCKKCNTKAYGPTLGQLRIRDYDKVSRVR